MRTNRRDPQSPTRNRMVRPAVSLLIAGLTLPLVLLSTSPAAAAVARGRAVDRLAAMAEWEQRAAMAGEGQVGQRAYPRGYVDDAMAAQERANFDAMPTAAGSAWQELGPVVAQVPPFWSSGVAFSGQTQTTSGRITALAVDPRCGDGAHGCRVWIGAAGGGVWRTDDALAQNVQWQSSSDGLPSFAIGSLLVDTTDPSGNRLYAGTGETNLCADNEAGLGLYKSDDGGLKWHLVSGSFSVAKDRSISSIVVDPLSPRHILIGTTLGRHGGFANVGLVPDVPPGAPTMGVYESSDGGQSFALVLSKPADTTAPETVRGGVTGVALDPRDPATVYVSLFDYGIWRRSARLDGDTTFHQVYAPLASPPANYQDLKFADRPQLTLTTAGGHTRIYVADGFQEGQPGQQHGSSGVWRTDDADVPAAQLSDGTNNPGWAGLSSATNGDPGFASTDYCHDQCVYDVAIAVDPKHPDTLWLGGSAYYNELLGGPEPFRSNGRVMQRSTDAGVHWTDITADANNPAFWLHPDQHAIAFDPANPDIAFFGGDGGIYRTDGQYTSTSALCDGRGLSGVDLADCRSWLSAVPNRLFSLNAGLGDLQFYSVAFNPANPSGSLLGGTQDNGTLVYSGTTTWLQTSGGDGGSSGFDAADPNITYANFFAAQTHVNFHSDDPTQWDWIADPLVYPASHERAAKYIPFLADPVVGGTAFAGLQHVWRTTDHGGASGSLDVHCNLATGDFATQCGDFVPLGPELTAGGGYHTGPFGLLSAVSRTSSDRSTLWAATAYGGVFVSHNAEATDPTTVTFTRLDTTSTPNRCPTAIAIDPADGNHAWVSYSGYDAYTPSTPGHVFEVRLNPATGVAAWIDVSHNLGDQPVTGVAYDNVTGDIYAGTDFGVLRLPATSATWAQAAAGLPPAAVYGLTIAPGQRILYAATHGRGIWRLPLPGAPQRGRGAS